MQSATSHLLVLGDLNTNILKPTQTHHFSHLQDLCSEHYLANIVAVPTRVPSDSCLDLMLVSSKFAGSVPAVIPLGDVTDHHLIKLSPTFPGLSTPQCSRIKVTQTVPFHLLDHDMSSATKAEYLRTNNSPSSPSLDVTAECLASSISKAMNLLTPLRTSVVPICPRPKPHPWVTPELRLLQRKKNRLHQKQKKQPDDERLKQQYRAARYQCIQLNKRLKTQLHETISPAATQYSSTMGLAKQNIRT